MSFKDSPSEVEGVNLLMGLVCFMLPRIIEMNIKSFLKLDWERWKVEISEQYLHCLVQSVYKLTFYIVVVH